MLLNVFWYQNITLGIDLFGHFNPNLGHFSLGSQTSTPLSTSSTGCQWNGTEFVICPLLKGRNVLDMSRKVYWKSMEMALPENGKHSTSIWELKLGMSLKCQLGSIFHLGSLQPMVWTSNSLILGISFSFTLSSMCPIWICTHLSPSSSPWPLPSTVTPLASQFTSFLSLSHTFGIFISGLCSTIC